MFRPTVAPSTHPCPPDVEGVEQPCADPGLRGVNTQRRLTEQDGRIVKLRQKISGGFAPRMVRNISPLSARLLSTARKQGWNMLQTLTSEPGRLITDIRLA